MAKKTDTKNSAPAPAETPAPAPEVRDQAEEAEPASGQIGQIVSRGEATVHRPGTAVDADGKVAGPSDHCPVEKCYLN